jgi:hypothetical protein
MRFSVAGVQPLYGVHSGFSGFVYSRHLILFVQAYESINVIYSYTSL